LSLWESMTGRERLDASTECISSHFATLASLALEKKAVSIRRHSHCDDCCFDTVQRVLMKCNTLVPHRRVLFGSKRRVDGALKEMQQTIKVGAWGMQAENR
jgi:hypothetical protein